jgi:hypothetical protein
VRRGRGGWRRAGERVFDDAEFLGEGGEAGGDVALGVDDRLRPSKMSSSLPPMALT